jgi:hypothetical protein
MQLFNYLNASVISIAGKLDYYAESIYIENPQRTSENPFKTKQKPDH